MKQDYVDGCNGCKISRGISHDVDQRGGIVELAGDWTLNHYGGPEGFLGWLVLQPRYHRMDIVDLTVEEAAAMGENIQRVDDGLRKYWSLTFSHDLVQRMYIAYFHESVFGSEESSQPSQDWHLHIHLVPRSVTMGRLLRRFSSDGSIRAWSTPDVVKLSGSNFPLEYKKTNENMSALMAHMRNHLFAKRP